MIWARCRKFLVAQWFKYHGAFSFSSMRYIPQDQLWLHNSIQGQTPWKHWKWLLRYLSLFLASETVCGKIQNYNVRLYVSRWQFVGWDIIANAGAQRTLNTSDCVRTGSFVNEAPVSWPLWFVIHMKCRCGHLASSFFRGRLRNEYMYMKDLIFEDHILFLRSSNIWSFIYWSGCTGIVEVMGSNPVHAWIFFQALISQLLKLCV